MSDDALRIGLQLIQLLRMRHVFSARTLHPAGIVDLRPGRGLRAQLQVGVPAGIEDDKRHLDVVLVRNGQKLVHPVEKALGILLPEQIVQKHADAVEAQSLCPAQFTVNRFRVERVRLPHFQIVLGGAGDEIAADQPAGWSQ